MTGFFEALFNMSITGSIVILVVIIARLFLQGVPKKYSYMLWAVAGFRLCCPFSFRSIISVFNISSVCRQGSVATGSGTMDYLGAPVAVIPEPDVAVPVEAIGGADGPTRIFVTASAMTIFNDIFPYIWLGGVVVLLAYALVSYIKLRKSLSTATRLEGNIFESDRITSPFILGVIKPKIYIPYGIDDSLCEYVLAHEKYHLRRGDNYVKLLAFVVLALHWFNPLCWIAFVLMSKDMEMSCDEWVLAHNDSIKKQFSQALLSFAMDRSFPSPSPLCFGEVSAKSRIKNVLKFKKPRVVVSVIVLVLCTVIAVVCIANPNAKVDAFKSGTDTSDIENMNIGAQMPDIIYADEKKVIFYGTCGIIVFDYEKQELTDRITWDEIDKLNWSYNRDFTNIYATNDGSKIYINEITQTDSHYFEYIYDVEKRKLTESKGEHSTVDRYIPESLLELDSKYIEFMNLNFLTSETGAVVGNRLLYLTASNDWSMASLELVVSDLNDQGNVRYIPIFSDEKAASRVEIITGFEKLGAKSYHTFHLSGNYEDYNTQVPSGTVKNQHGGVFSVVKAETQLLDENLESRYAHSIEYDTDKGKVTLLCTNSPDLHLLAYIDDNLFFSAGDTIYRMKLLYNGTEVESKYVNYVYYGQYGLRYAGDSNLALTLAKETLYLDTRTGETSSWDMTKYVPKISEAKAIDTAKSALGDKLEKNISDFKQQGCKLRNSNCISGKDNGGGNPLFEVAFSDTTTGNTFYLYIDAENGNYVSYTIFGD